MFILIEEPHREAWFLAAHLEGEAAGCAGDAGEEGGGRVGGDGGLLGDGRPVEQEPRPAPGQVVFRQLVPEAAVYQVVQSVLVLGCREQALLLRLPECDRSSLEPPI